MYSEVVIVPSPPQKKINDKLKFKRKKTFISNQKKYNLLDLEIHFLVNIDKINKKFGGIILSNSFILRNIENVNLQHIEFLFSQINSYINSYEETLNLNEMNELIQIINNLFNKSKNI